MAFPHDGKKFKQGTTGNPNGRPKKIYTLIKHKGYSVDDLRAALLEMGWHNMEELEKIFRDNSKPAILKVVAHAFKKAAEKGDYRFIKEILEQAIGKPKQPIDLDHTISAEPITGMIIRVRDAT